MQCLNVLFCICVYVCCAARDFPGDSIKDLADLPERYVTNRITKLRASMALERRAYLIFTLGRFVQAIRSSKSKPNERDLIEGSDSAYGVADYKLIAQNCMRDR